MKKSWCVYICSVLLSATSALDTTHDSLLKRLEYLERKDAEQDAIIARQEKEITNLKICNCQSNSEHIRETVVSSGKVNHKRFILNDSPVAFTAAIAARVVDHLDHQDTVKFETVITEIGGGYNNLSGLFVVPVTGVYMFSCSLLDDDGTGTMVHGEIVHQNRVLGRIFAHAEVKSTGSYRDQGAQTVFTHAHAGDQVWVRVVDQQNLGLGGELYSTFSGYLLYAME